VVDESKDWEWNVTPEIEKQNQVELQLEDNDTVTVQEMRLEKAVLRGQEYL